MGAETKIEASLASAMAAAFGEIEAATKSAANPHLKSKYADLGSVIDAVKPPLIKHGLFFTQHPHPCEGGVSVETFLRHANGEALSLGTLFVPANKNDAQGFGSALTYARRYSLMTAFGVPTEDDDGNAAAKSAPARVSNAVIDDGQWATITQLIQASGSDTQAFCKFYSCPSTKALSAVKYDDAVKALNAKIAKIAKLAPAGDILDDAIPY